ncbi:YggS family pyridoxal phosphate enzyme, partial [Candidatus Gottesmanbacteria bacterium]|nr:YggS family pyridoxal phosphate enzyme [Candidatus Gottesmanbacteria bacterium]
MNIISLPQSVTLVAVTKTFPVSVIEEAYAHGVRHFGENYVEEFEEKYSQLPGEIKQHAIFHMIGHVQSRKVKRAVELFDWVDSVDTVGLAQKLDEAAG